MKTLVVGLLSLSAVLAVAAPADAQSALDDSIFAFEARRPDGGEVSVRGYEEMAPDDAESGWRFDASLYLWAISLSGTSSLATVDADIDAEFSKIVENLLDGAFFFRAEAWSDRRFGILFDFSWVDLGLDEEVTLPGPRGRGVDVDLDVRQVDVLLAGAYRLLDLSETDPGAGGAEHSWVSPQRVTVDLYGGCRYGYLREKLDLDPGPHLGDSASWFEPVVGVRLAWHPADWVGFAVRADAGGFGLGGAPDTDVFLLLGARFRLGSLVSLDTGYQWRWFDYQSGHGTDEFGLDALYQGPVLALTFSF